MKSRIPLYATLLLAGMFSWHTLYADSPPGVIPPIKTPSVATAIQGAWNGQLAYSPSSNEWLVVGETGDLKILGQMMDDKNKPVGTTFEIDAQKKQSRGAKVAWDDSAKKFLVVWINYNGSTGTIYGQFVDQNGKLLGDNFEIANGPYTLKQNASLEFDPINKNFVLGWYGQAGNDFAVWLGTIGEDGTPGEPVQVAYQPGVQLQAPFIAVNTQKGEYCVAYVNPDPPYSIAVRLVNPLAATVGNESIVYTSSELAELDGISYDSTDDQYLVLWKENDLDLHDQLISGDCEGNPDDTPADLGVGNAATVTYNPASNAFGIIAQDQDTNNNNLYLIDASSGNSIGEVSPPFTAGSTGNFSPSIAPNPLTGAFAAITGEDRQSTKFIADIGRTLVTINPNTKGVIAPAQQNTVPSEGLPTDLGQFIGAIFLWSLRIIGLIIFVRFFWAGFLWFTSAGNSGRISRAKDIMKNAALGAVVLFAAYLILYSINPDFVAGSLNLPGISGPAPTTQTTTGGTGATPITCTNNVCSNGVQGACRADTDCGAPVACNNGLCNNGFIGACQTAAQCGGN